MLIMRRGRMEGFIVLDYASRFVKPRPNWPPWCSPAHSTTKNTFFTDWRRPPKPQPLVSGGNHGKTLVVVDDSVQLG